MVEFQPKIKEPHMSSVCVATVRHHTGGRVGTSNTPSSVIIRPTMDSLSALHTRLVRMHDRIRGAADRGIWEQRCGRRAR